MSEVAHPSQYLLLSTLRSRPVIKTREEGTVPGKQEQGEPKAE